MLVSSRNAAIDALSAVSETEGGAVLAALSCGWKRGLTQSEAYRSFKKAGLAHLVAVSGAHLSLTCALLFGLLRFMRAPRCIAAGLQVAVVFVYLVLCAVPPSAVRAALMALASLGSMAARRRAASLSAVGACIIICLAGEPSLAVSASFALSALSTLGIVLFAPLMAAWFSQCRFVPVRLAASPLALTLASAILALPLTAALFAEVSIVSPMANVVAAPLFPLACASGLVVVAASAIAPAGAGILLSAGCFFSNLLVGVAHLFSSFPYASVPVALDEPVALGMSALVAATLYIAWPSSFPTKTMASILAVAIVAGAFGYALERDTTKITMLDVGQGDAIAIRSAGVTVLIDTGNRESALREALARQHIGRIDALVVTHPDDDHAKEIESLAAMVPVDAVYVASDMLACSCDSCRDLVVRAHRAVGAERVTGLEKGDIVSCGALTLEVVWPSRFRAEGGNADSLCLKGSADVDGDGFVDWTALFAGDAENEQLEEMVAEGLGPIDVFKAGHHGSRACIGRTVAEKLSSQVALVSVGARNRYGHPNGDVLALLEECGARVWRTDESGDVSCILGRTEMKIETMR